MTKKNHSWQCT